MQPYSYRWKNLCWHVSQYTLSIQSSHVYAFYVGTFPVMIFYIPGYCITRRTVSSGYELRISFP